VPGCSTGEEAYSMAILLREHMPKGHASPRLQVFATDIDEEALQIARVGRYPAAIARDIPQDRLERYFVREDGTYRIVAELREICLFSPHNLLRDAPFSRLDLVSCRNVLVYFAPAARKVAQEMIEAAVRPGGFLLLGPTDPAPDTARFEAIWGARARIFFRTSCQCSGRVADMVGYPSGSGRGGIASRASGCGARPV